VTKDPVCGKRINRGKAHAAVEYNHFLYFLCCPVCQAQFEKEPRRYAKPDIGVRVKQGVQ